MNPKVAIYARVSTRDQDPGMQLLDLRQYATERGFEVCHEFVDVRISGMKESRSALDELMQEARKRKFDIVLVWRFDRFARSTKHLLVDIKEVKRLKEEGLSYREIAKRLEYIDAKGRCRKVSKTTLSDLFSKMRVSEKPS